MSRMAFTSKVLVVMVLAVYRECATEPAIAAG
jgi:hypothetical protein